MKKSLLTIAAVVMMAFAVNTNAQQMAVGVQAGIAVPMGTPFSDMVDMGFGGLGTFLYTINPQIQVTGAVGYLTFGYKEVEGTNIDGSFSIIPIVVGGRYLIGQGTTKPYVMAELGMYMGSSGDITVSSGNFSMTIPGESTSDFGIAPGVGVLIPAGEKLNIDINAKYNVISDSNFLSVLAGVQVAL